DIDAVQDEMPRRGIVPKAVVEGPPSRTCPILLRQTSFKAIEERVAFPCAEGKLTRGSHTARFGEIEQRGIALTPKGRVLYDRLLNEARANVRPAADGSNAQAYCAALQESFAAFPDDWSAIRKAGLGYFLYSVVASADLSNRAGHDIEALIEAGAVRFDPIVYEDFLPVSAAGIFQSNLGDAAVQEFVASPNQKLFEKALGAAVLNEFDHYAGIERASIEQCLSAVRTTSVAA
ncbi:MAG: VOC family protein, partial [Hyphomicrobiaceae bacterium]